MSRKLRIRMYQVGFGDCFLLSFLGPPRNRHILIDCGSITDGKDQVGRVAQDVVAACTPSGGGKPRLELVVATHRHRDHVSGFNDLIWQGVEVGEVWMPWTEDPEDGNATRIRNRQSAFALALTRSLALAGFDAEAAPLEGAAPGSDAEAVKQATLSMALNALTNERAMDTLHNGFAGDPPRHFLPTKDTVCEARKVPHLPGVKIHVLGPPRDEAAMSVMQPPPEEVYLRLAASGAAEPATAVGAFRTSWRVERPVFETRQAASTFNAADQRQVNRLAEEPDGELAAAIDRAVNNTSLILMIEAGGQWLLFPGDAQWGAWNAALREPRCRALLEKTTVYKIGHHGSENATPKSLVEQVIDQPFTAFLSTKPVPQWPNIPRAPMVEAMLAKDVKVARSDATAGAPFKVKAGLYTEWQVALG